MKRKDRERAYLADNEANDGWTRELDDGVTEADVGMATQVNTHAAVAESIVVGITSCEARRTHRLHHTGTVLYREPKPLRQLLWCPTSNQTFFSFLCDDTKDLSK